MRSEPPSVRARCHHHLVAVAAGALGLLYACELEPTTPPVEAATFAQTSAADTAVRVENLELGAFALIALAPTELGRVAELEQLQADGTWAALDALDDGAGYTLDPACRPPERLSACLTLGAGETLLPKPWSGFECAAQCGRACANDRFHAGVHRLVVRACDDLNAGITGAPFELPSAPAMFARWRATTDLVAATVMRAEFSDDAATGPKLLEHFVPQLDSEREVELSALNELVRLVRSVDGFNDDVAKRCRSGPTLAISGVHRPIADEPDAPLRSSEIVLDFGCSSLRVPGAGSEPVAMAYFDPSRAAFVALARRLLPSDADMRELR